MSGADPVTGGPDHYVDARTATPYYRRLYAANSGWREVRLPRSTNRPVSLYDGIAAGMDVGGGRWQTVCEDHGGIVSHTTYALARHHMAAPEDWCPGCGPCRCTDATGCTGADGGHGCERCATRGTGDCGRPPAVYT